MDLLVLDAFIQLLKGKHHVKFHAQIIVYWLLLFHQLYYHWPFHNFLLHIRIECRKLVLNCCCKMQQNERWCIDRKYHILKPHKREQWFTTSIRTSNVHWKTASNIRGTSSIIAALYLHPGKNNIRKIYQTLESIIIRNRAFCSSLYCLQAESAAEIMNIKTYTTTKPQSQTSGLDKTENKNKKPIMY